MRKIIRLIIGIYALGMIGLGGWQLFTYYRDSFASRETYETMTSLAVVEREITVREAQEEDTEPQESSAPKSPAPISVDFETLKKSYEDIVAWLYMEDSVIHYPVAQGEDNEYYLSHMLDGSENRSGSLFMDYRNKADLTDLNTVIFGHNMKDETVFGALDLYKDQAYYDAHPVMWLLTPEGDYKVELLAGLVVPGDSMIYSLELSQESQLDNIRQAIQGSTFKSQFTPEPDDRYLTLSTCSYEYDEARYLLIGRLVPVT